MTTHGQPRAFTFRDVVKERLPDIVRGEHRTHSISGSRTNYVGPFNEWGSFEKEVRATSQELMVSFPAELQDIMMYEQPTTEQFSFGNELVVCGNEIGVSGRFTQHLGQVMSSIAQRLDIRL